LAQIGVHGCPEQGTNVRFVVTNRPGVDGPHDAQREYDNYVQRGESEHRMDEMKNGLHIDRLSCHRFMANFFRLLLRTAVMNLQNAARNDQILPEVQRVGQPCAWRTHVIKVAAVIVQSTRRILVKPAAHWPWRPI
jgi:Transposase DDE domain group 1